jgi:glycosyltransferase involved in cell wall biosynthesis
MLQATIVIATCNRRDKLQRCLVALERQTLPKTDFEVIIVDDGSQDDTGWLVDTFIRKSDMRLKYYFQKNRGPASARNLGISKVQTDYIVFTDDDCIPTSDWLEKLMEQIPNGSLWAGTGGKIVRYNNDIISRYIDHCGAMNHGSANGTIHYLVTANALYRASCLSAVKGFDERISWPGGEDPDLSFRIQDLGYYLTITPAAVIRHDHKNTLRGLFRMFQNYGRGRFVLMQLERGKRINMTRYLVNQYITAPIKYAKIKDLRFHERIMFCVLKWIQHTGIYIGYLQCRKVFKSQL